MVVASTTIAVVSNEYVLFLSSIAFQQLSCEQTLEKTSIIDKRFFFFFNTCDYF